MIRGFRKNAGFTLVELLVATTIGTFIVLVAVGALKTMSDGAAYLDREAQVTGEVRFAATALAHDLANVYRDLNPRNTKLVGYSAETSPTGGVSLLFHALSRAKARPSRPESDVYEIEYFLVKKSVEEQGQLQEKSILFRRIWPYPSEDVEPGGVVMPIAERIEVFEVRYFDGEEWAAEWPEQMEGLPRLVEITIAAERPQKAEPVVETLLVSFPRLSGMQDSGEMNPYDQGDGGSDEPQQDDQGQQDQQGNEEGRANR